MDWAWFWQGSVTRIGREFEGLYTDLLWLLAPMLIVGLGFLVVGAFRKGGAGGGAARRSGRTTLYQLIWGGLAAVVAYLVVSPSLAMWDVMRGPESIDPEALPIRIVAEDGDWVATYPGLDGVLDTPDDYQIRDTLTLAADRPVRLILESDELRTFSMRQLRMKRDVGPKRPTEFQFEPDFPGFFPIGCDVDCGPGHPLLLGTLRVIRIDRYRLWTNENSNAALGTFNLEPIT